MALTYYLKIDGIAGDSTSTDHKGWFELPSFSLGEHNSSIVSSGTQGKVFFEDLDVTLGGNTALTSLLDMGASGEFINALEIEGVEAGTKGNQTVYDLTLNKVRVSSIDASESGGDDPFLQVSFNFGQIGLVTIVPDSAGGPGSKQSFGWDILASKPIAPTALDVPANTTAIDAVPDPTTYYLKIDGIDGSSKAKGHEGWFELPAFSFGESIDLNVSTGGSGTVQFSDLSLSLQGNAALAALLADGAGGKVIASLEIEGVTADSADVQTVFDLTLNKVQVSSISQNGERHGGDSVNVAFNFDQIGLVTIGRNAKGILSDKHSFGWDVAKNTSIAPSSLDVPANASTDAVPSPDLYYLKIDGIRGDSFAQGHVGWFELESFSLFEEYFGGGGGGSGGGKVSFGDLALTLRNDAGLAALLDAGASGAVIASLEIEGVSGGLNGGKTVYDLTLNDVRVSSVNASAEGGGAPGVDVAFNFGQIGLVTTGQKADGSLGSKHSFGWDVVLNKPLDPATLDVPANTPAIDGVLGPVTYYLKIDGIDGDSLSAQHKGWFELPSFSIGEFNTASLSAAGTAGGKVIFDDLELSLTGSTALSALLAAGAHGTIIRALEIEGVVTGSKVDQTVYDLTLNSLRVGSVSESASGNGGAAIDVAFNFAQIGLVTTGQNADGSLGDKSSFGWDLAANKSIAPADLKVPVNTAIDSVPEPAIYYLRIDGIAGDSRSTDHKGWFELQSFDFGETNFGAVNGGSAGGAKAPSGSTVEFSEIALSLKDHTALAALLLTGANGKHISSLEIEGVTGVLNGAKTVYDLTLNDLLVSSVSESANSDGSGAMSIAFNFGQIGLMTISENRDGNASSKHEFGWDVVGNKSIDPASLKAPVSQFTDAVPEPTLYYLKIDGVTGNSTSKNHKGWFELPSFDFSEIIPAAVSGNGAGKASFSDLSLTLTNNAALAALRAASASGKFIKALEIEGVTGKSDLPVYDLTLNTVLVSSVSEDASPGRETTTDVTFNFGRIGLVTASQKLNGSLGDKHFFGWDLIANKAIDPASLAVPGSAGPIAGNAQDGYIAGATVFADANGNGLLDPGEISALTNATGQFSLAAGATGALVMTGGIDVSTGLAFTGRMRAPENSTVVTPLTTLIAILIDGGESQTSAETLIKAALGLPSGADLADFDPIAAILAGGANGPSVFTGGTIIANTMALTAALLDGLGASAADAENAILTALAQIIAAGGGALLDLTNAATIAALIAAAASAAHVDASAVKDDAAAVIAASNALAKAALDSGAGGTDLLKQLAQIDIVAQGEAANALETAGETGNAGAAKSAYTGAALTSAVAAAAGGVGDVDGAVNNAPETKADSASVKEDTPPNPVTGNVLANDRDTDFGDTFAVTAVNGNSASVGADLAGIYGTLHLNPDGGYSYTLDNGKAAVQALGQAQSATEVFHYTVSDNHGAAASNDLTVTIQGTNDGPSAPVDNDPAANKILEGSGNGTAVGITARSTDIDGPSLTYSLTNNAGGRFAIDPTTGSVTVANGSLLDFEAATSHTIVVQASDGLLAATQSFTIDVINRPGVTIMGTRRADLVDATHTVPGQPLPTDEEDSVFGGRGDDRLSGLGGNDFIDGGRGSDRMAGGLGDDVYIVNKKSDMAIENANEGIDTVRASVSFTLGDNVENLTLIDEEDDDDDREERGRDGDDDGDFRGTGNAQDNTINGNSGSNILSGLAGNDVLKGGGGNDILIGGLGKDRMSGDAGKDIFDFNAVQESDSAIASADIVDGFVHGADKIDVSTIDANIATRSDNKFLWGGQNMAAVANSATWSESNGNTILRFDNNGDAIADMTIVLTGTGLGLTASDFIL